MKPLASIIIPTRHRAKLLDKRLNYLLKNTPELFNGKADLIIAYDEDDNDTSNLRNKFGGILEIYWFSNPPLEIPCVKWNNAARKARGEWLVTISDDCMPEDKWLGSALNTVNRGFLGLPDGVTGDRNNLFTPLYMATKEWLRKYNGGVLVIPCYKSWFADVETCIRARRSNTYIVSKNSVVTQLHPVFKTAQDDEMYKLGETRRAEDFKTYHLREDKGFPDDFERCL